MPFHDHLGHHAIEAVLTMLYRQAPGRIVDGRQRHLIVSPFGILQSGDDEGIVINKADAAALFQSRQAFGGTFESDDFGTEFLASFLL